ncbi:MAG: FHA domain-containing protein [SAR324 cluster bacterium]|uniref:FHA domain-containing protein n=1 Tax=SAR324 cluster bacterium TaxID=2024889 RepID=A0A7X9FQK5_9DELT|nr:FHA domain-containing protein [SAR324 cluster bacterium]
MSREKNTAKDLSAKDRTAKVKRLVGWLVSYGLDSNGIAFELRSGRIFVSSGPLLPAGQNGNNGNTQNGCIIINDESISSLHLAINATASHQLFIQDIFSEHGTFLKRSGESEEKKITGVCEIRHGDWIRIGEKNRFQVCLIHGRRN